MLDLNISTTIPKKVTDRIVFTDKNFNITDNILRKLIIFKDIKALKNLLDEKKNENFFCINNFNVCPEKTIFINFKEDLSSIEIQQLGGQVISKFKNNSDINIFFNSEEQKYQNMFYNFFLGATLKKYSFLKYKTVIPEKKKDNLKKLNLIVKNKVFFHSIKKKIFSLASSVFFTRDLVSEPPNVLSPEMFVKEIKKLSSLGIKIVVYDLNKLKKLGMNAIIGVSQGSKNLPFFVTMEWKPKNHTNKKPLSFIGKGVCFDTGGISLKPAKFMEDMKYDMAGAGAIAGLMRSVALSKINKYVVGAVALVENMPSGSAQRPGDVVKSYSGKTIEILNTDAEGRLILADAIHYVEKHYNPDLIVDLATLTGAIVVSLGNEYAGIFSNNDKLANTLIKSGEVEGEKLWKFPLHKNYDDLMNSEIADVQNINYSGGAGSITAAQFLQRFISKNTAWAHLDIAGMAWTKKDLDITPKGATGFGVKLLTNFVENYS